jgi:hypothetical protein
MFMPSVILAAYLWRLADQVSTERQLCLRAEPLSEESEDESARLETNLKHLKCMRQLPIANPDLGQNFRAQKDPLQPFDSRALR